METIMLEPNADYYRTTYAGLPLDELDAEKYTLVVIFHGRLGAITSQKFHCSSLEHAGDVLEQLKGIDNGQLEYEYLKGHL